MRHYKMQTPNSRFCLKTGVEIFFDAAGIFSTDKEKIIKELDAEIEDGNVYITSLTELLPAKEVTVKEKLRDFGNSTSVNKILTTADAIANLKSNLTK